MRNLLLASTAAAALLLAAAPASALSVSNLADAPAAWAAAIADTPNTLNLPGTWAAGADPSVRTGNLANVYRSPFDNQDLPGNPDNSAFIGLSYFAVGPGNPNNPAVMTFAADQTSLKFLWGSVDDYNGLEFFKGGVSIASITSALIAPPPGNAAGRGAAYVLISGLVFDEVHFSSSTNAFEFSNLSTTPVPLPAALPLTLAGLAGLGLIARRRPHTAA